MLSQRLWLPVPVQSCRSIHLDVRRRLPPTRLEKDERACEQQSRDMRDVGAQDGAMRSGRRDALRTARAPF
eukprot:6214495-Pleurochrysis_carterae.AAC.2